MSLWKVNDHITLLHYHWFGSYRLWCFLWLRRFGGLFLTRFGIEGIDGLLHRLAACGIVGGGVKFCRARCAAGSAVNSRTAAS